MKCPKCGFLEDKVIESRQIEDGECIRRRRECIKCEYRFTSYERIKEKTIKVVKKDGRREDFSSAKLLLGISKAIEKRPVSQDTIEKLVLSIEERCISDVDDSLEINSLTIGEMVMEALLNIDKVAYIRFASVYIDGEEEFKEKIKNVLK